MNKLQRWWKKYDALEPSHGLSKLGIIVAIVSAVVTFLLTIVTTFLAALAYNQAVEIKGMQDVLKELKSSNIQLSDLANKTVTTINHNSE